MSTVVYVAVVEGSQDEGYSAFFPDLPGCVTAAETAQELPAAAREALSLHLQGMAEDGHRFPDPSPIEAINVDPDIREVGRVLVDAELEDHLVRVNISVGQQFLKRLDAAADANGMTRSAFLIEGARGLMRGPVHTRASLRGADIILFPKPSHATADERYLVVPCQGQADGLAVIWDRIEEQVVDVISRDGVARWTTSIVGSGDGVVAKRA